MATHLLTFRPTGIQACAIPGYRKPDPNRRKSTSSSSSANWWAPMFGWSSEPDYIDSDQKTEAKEKRDGESERDLGQQSARTKFSPGCFTEEKARQLRMMTTKTSSFHDVMYHSAIASRLASNFKDPSDL
ncbi:hypothetical protein QUC31_020017 [Theobroma cacao]|uniref:Uncharacterized protein n=1 Tax=Theobroma cacao TaxID=3641 RepID=A0A061GM41_THECC|nr:Uncharacterized protein TCM_037996 [Theobroma cacao]WRX34978.1 hypothetical protein QQP08_027465 [Theobroma cacao]